ncbi:MAG: Hpt domain-containing protein [Flavobacteriaceae bacterium]
MGKYYRLNKIKELADNDEGFIKELVVVFLNEIPEDIKIIEKAVSKNDYGTTYQVAHKIKPTIDLFEINALDAVINIQDWGKRERMDVDVHDNLSRVVKTLDKAIAELKADFNL